MAGEKILVVDDEPGVRSALDSILIDEGFQVTGAASGEEGLERVLDGEFDAIFLDIWLPGIDGIETLKRLQSHGIDAEVVMISGHGTIETAVRATKLGAFDFIEKPLSLEKTLLVLRNALRQRSLERANRRLLERLSRDTEILGASPAATGLRAQVEVAASSDGPVLILGERGTGREMVARRIHTLSARSENAFLDIPCAALGDEAIRDALFGTATTSSRLALASRGTVYLENVHGLDPALQHRLADYLESRDFLELNVRVLAGSEPELPGLDAALGRRFDVLRCEVPPLRHRREDILPLAERFMTELAREYGRQPRQISSESSAALTAYDWPGNAVELRNLVERLLLTVEGERIERHDLPVAMGGPDRKAVDLYGDLGSLDEARAAFESHYVRRTLEAAGNDFAIASRRLGIEPEEIRNRLRNSGSG